MRALDLTVDRDSVAAGDDCVSHAAALTIDASITVVELLTAAQRVCPLAGIIGGRATWIADAGGEGVAPFAVLAEQWREPKLLVPAATTAAALIADPPRVLYFRYWCQADPDTVFTALRTGAPLPSRYG
jgi:hypothetical protein